jgi:hypothetical protein
VGGKGAPRLPLSTTGRGTPQLPRPASPQGRPGPRTTPARTHTISQYNSSPTREASEIMTRHSLGPRTTVAVSEAGRLSELAPPCGGQRLSTVHFGKNKESVFAPRRAGGCSCPRSRSVRSSPRWSRSTPRGSGACTRPSSARPRAPTTRVTHTPRPLAPQHMTPRVTTHNPFYHPWLHPDRSIHKRVSSSQSVSRLSGIELSQSDIKKSITKRPPGACGARG